MKHKKPDLFFRQMFRVPRRAFQDRGGQSTLEVIVAITILFAGITAAILVIFGGQSLSLDAQESSVALRIAEEEIEKIEAQARYDFAGIASGSSVVGEFTKDVSVVEEATSTKRVTVTVSWRTDPLRPQKVELITLVTDWTGEEALGGDTGGGGLTGDWSNPQTLGSVDLGPGNSATDLDVIDKFVYMSAVASAQSKPDFFIIDATDGENPSISSNLNTGKGLNALDVAGDYAYAAHDESEDSQLQVIDITNRANPVLATEFDLPGVTDAVGWSIFFYSNKVYVGTERSAAGPEFHVVDVSDPQAPSALGDFEVNADVNSIHVSGNYAYLATSRDAAEVLILDVSDPAAIAEAGTFNATGTADGLFAYLRGTKLYLGRDASGEDELVVLDVSDVGSVSNLGSVGINDDINGITARDHLAFLATSDTNGEFQAWDISDPASITHVSTFNFPNIANGIDYEDNLVYVAVRSNDSLRIITSQ